MFNENLNLLKSIQTGETGLWRLLRKYAQYAVSREVLKYQKKSSMSLRLSGKMLVSYPTFRLGDT